MHGLFLEVVSHAHFHPLSPCPSLHHIWITYIPVFFFFLKAMPNPASSPELQMKVSPIEDVHYFHCNSQTAAQGPLPPPPKKGALWKQDYKVTFPPKSFKMFLFYQPKGSRTSPVLLILGEKGATWMRDGVCQPLALGSYSAFLWLLPFNKKEEGWGNGPDKM